MIGIRKFKKRKIEKYMKLERSDVLPFLGRSGGKSLQIFGLFYNYQKVYKSSKTRKLLYRVYYCVHYDRKISGSRSCTVKVREYVNDGGETVEFRLENKNHTCQVTLIVPPPETMIGQRTSNSDTLYPLGQPQNVNLPPFFLPINFTNPIFTSVVSETERIDSQNTTIIIPSPPSPSSSLSTSRSSKKRKTSWDHVTVSKIMEFYPNDGNGGYKDIFVNLTPKDETFLLEYTHRCQVMLGNMELSINCVRRTIDCGDLVKDIIDVEEDLEVSQQIISSHISILVYVPKKKKNEDISQFLFAEKGVVKLILKDLGKTLVWEKVFSEEEIFEDLDNGPVFD